MLGPIWSQESNSETSEKASASLFDKPRVCYSLKVPTCVCFYEEGELCPTTKDRLRSISMLRRRIMEVYLPPVKNKDSSQV